MIYPNTWECKPHNPSFVVIFSKYSYKMTCVVAINRHVPLFIVSSTISLLHPLPPVLSTTLTTLNATPSHPSIPKSPFTPMLPRQDRERKRWQEEWKGGRVVIFYIFSLIHYKYTSGYIWGEKRDWFEKVVSTPLLRWRLIGYLFWPNWIDPYI